MMPSKRDWVFSFLWINFAVVVVILVLIAGNQISGCDLLRILVFFLFYVNLIGFLGLLILGGVAGKLVRNPPPIPLVATAMLVIVLLGCLLAEMLRMSIGFIAPGQF